VSRGATGRKTEGPAEKELARVWIESPLVERKRERERERERCARTCEGIYRTRGRANNSRSARERSGGRRSGVVFGPTGGR